MIFRAGLLQGRRVLIGGGGQALAEALDGLGAAVETIDAAAPAATPADANRRSGDSPPVHALVYDTRPGFRTGGPEALQQCLEETWICAHAVATSALI
ncbi:MAG: hypothetical protein M3016_06825, partial [Actinomycetota bacterium]|nr:hypothetical protein [Actinomycetota bacterium]